MDCNQLFFPNIHCLFEIFCTMSVTSCECERSISGIRRLKTFLRTSMGEESMYLLLYWLQEWLQIDVWVSKDRFFYGGVRPRPPLQSLVSLAP